jgi:MFS family permease
LKLQVFEAFQHRDFRNMWLGACVSSIGTWMQKLAQSWLVFEISKDPFYLGLDSFLGQIPIFFLSLFGGVAADRFDRRHLLIGSQIVQMSCALILAALFFFQVVEVWHILLLSFTTGIAQAFGGPAYQALVPMLIPRETLPNAIALNSMQFNTARIIGPMLGALTLKHLNPTWCFGINAVSFLFVILTLVILSAKLPTARIQNGSVLDSMKEGFRCIETTGGMKQLVMLAFLMTFFGLPLMDFLPVFAKDVFGGGEDMLSHMMVISGLGSIAGAMVIAALGKRITNMGVIASLLLVLGLFTFGFGFSRSLPLSLFCLFLAGATLIGLFALVSSMVQMSTDDTMRGRVMSVYNVAFRGGMPFGSFVMGDLTKGGIAIPTLICSNGVALVLLGALFFFLGRPEPKEAKG